MCVHLKSRALIQRKWRPDHFWGMCKLVTGHVNAGKSSYELDLSHEDRYGLTAETMSLLLDWVYDDFNVDLTYPQTVSLFLASHMLDITDLHLQCERVLKTFITMDTFFQLSDLAGAYCMGGALAQLFFRGSVLIPIGLLQQQGMCLPEGQSRHCSICCTGHRLSFGLHSQQSFWSLII